MKQLDVLKIQIRLIERDTRLIAKEKGVRVRRHRHSGIWAHFPDGTKKYYHGWKHIFSEFVHLYGRSG